MATSPLPSPNRCRDVSKPCAVGSDGTVGSGWAMLVAVAVGGREEALAVGGGGRIGSVSVGAGVGVGSGVSEGGGSVAVPSPPAWPTAQGTVWQKGGAGALPMAGP